jgi:tetratricopeptide (TPR) repeat protein
MPKRYFGKAKKRGPGVGAAVLALVVLMVLVAVAGYLYRNGSPALLSQGTADADASKAALEDARRLVGEGDFAAATEKLKPLLALADPVLTPRAIVLLADAEAGAGNADGALKTLEQAVGEYRASPEYPALAARYARQLEKAGRGEEAAGLYQSLRDNAPDAFRAAGLTGLGRMKEAAGDLVAARDLYREGVETAVWGSTEWNEAVDPLGKLNVQLIFSPTPLPESRYYAIEKGDSITSIGIKLNTTQGLLLRANSMDDAARLTLGARLKYTPKDFSIVLERSTCQLFLFDNRGLFKRYHVGLGMPGHETALGKYTIGNKQKDPTWFKPGAGPVTSGDPGNELGTRWMPLVPAEPSLPTDLGIHGTIHPETVGEYSSHGCARLTNPEVEELYDLIVRSTPVTIVDKYVPGSAAVAAETEEAAVQVNEASAPAEPASN